MTEQIMIVLKQAADMEINLGSETARKWLAETIKKSINDWYMDT
tara:strand:- start:1262 stop:1393 length:132 start_codon:yes stop_codon:yes gene_type:complete